MLYNPKWSKPNVKGFKTWLEKQPQDQRFDFASCRTCAVGQYLESIGTEWFELDRRNPSLLCELNSFAARVATFDNRLHPTFGDVLHEVRKVYP